MYLVKRGASIMSENGEKKKEENMTGETLKIENTRRRHIHLCVKQMVRKRKSHLRVLSVVLVFGP